MRKYPTHLLVMRYQIMAGIGLLSVFALGLWHWSSEKEPTDSPSGIELEEFTFWLNTSLNTLSWELQAKEHGLNRAILEQSLELGRLFLINNQKAEGNFNYEYDFVRKIISTDDRQVRQAGVLWGLALIYQYNQDLATRNALDKGLDFFFKNSRKGPIQGSLLIAYPDTKECRTGTVALVALTIIEYLRTEQTARMQIDARRREELLVHLNGYLKYLEYLYLKNGHFSESFSIETETRSRRSNPYFDGETLLCLIKAARYLGHTELIPVIEESAIQMAKRYTIEAWREEVDSPLTKGFYQWGTMAFWEYQEAGWKHAEILGDTILVLAWWMIHTHRTLERMGNTAYAYEGLIYAYQMSKTRNLDKTAKALANTIDTGLYKLTGWQVGGPLGSLNPFLREHDTNDLLAIGGIMNRNTEPLLRIDINQHQMHAVILALTYVYTDNPDNVI